MKASEAKGRHPMMTWTAGRQEGKRERERKAEAAKAGEEVNQSKVKRSDGMQGERGKERVIAKMESRVQSASAAQRGSESSVSERDASDSIEAAAVAVL